MAFGAHPEKVKLLRHQSIFFQQSWQHCIQHQAIIGICYPVQTIDNVTKK